MRILTVRQPWADAIVNNAKGVENRSRNIAGDYRGPVAIHAGLAYDEGATVWAGDQPFPVDEDGSSREPRGAIIGVVNLWAVHYHDGTSGFLCCARDNRYRWWAHYDSWHLCMVGARRLSEPIPYRGALGLRTIDADTIALIESRLS